MDSFEMTKIAGAVLAALLLIFGTKTFIEIAGEGHAEKAGYTLPEASAAGGAKEAAGDAGGAAEADAVALLGSASADNGKTVFSKCKSCHSVDKGKNGVGPTLYGIVKRGKAAIDGFKYSDAMKAKGGDWSFEELSKFLTNPKAEVAGTKMTFAGISSAQDRADLMAYLATVGDAPVPLPAAGAAPAEKTEAKPDAEAEKKADAPADAKPSK